jgi:hypothetical protein
VKRSTSGWQIVSNISIGPVRFGMTRADVRTAIGVKANPFKKTADSESLTDAFTLGGTRVAGEAARANADHVHVYYDAADRCALVEVSAAGLGGPELDGRGFVNRPYERALAWVRDRDPDVVIDTAGLRSAALGIALYAPADKVESVAAFAASYWAHYAQLRQ